MSINKKIKAFSDKLANIICNEGKQYKNIRINSNIDFYIGGKLVKGKARSSIHGGKYPDISKYIDVFANGKTYLCRFDGGQNKFVAII